jgi:hypothetical protein
MRKCPCCNTPMEEKEEPNQVQNPPQLMTEGPFISSVHRVRSECPNCHHVEAGFPD